MLRASLIILALSLSSAVFADLEVHTRRDTVVLEDGSEIPCRVLMITNKGVLIVEADAADPEKKSQRIIPREKIRSIIRDERNGAIQGLQTESELARKVVKGSGFRKDESATETTVADAPKSAGPVAPATTFANAQPAGPGPFAGTTPSVAAPKATAPAGGKDVTVEIPKGTLSGRELTDAYLTRFPELRGAGMDLLGDAQMQEWFNNAREGNESARRPLENNLKAYLGVADKDRTTPTKTPIRPMRRTVKEEPAEQ